MLQALKGDLSFLCCECRRQLLKTSAGCRPSVVAQLSTFGILDVSISLSFLNVLFHYCCALAERGPLN